MLRCDVAASVQPQTEYQSPAATAPADFTRHNPGERRKSDESLERRHMVCWNYAPPEFLEVIDRMVKAERWSRGFASS